jgi:hypothetical protein
LSTTKKSWHLINAKELGSSLAYVIPSLNKNSVSFYVFFLNRDFFTRLFQGQSQLDNVSLVSPYLGEIYSVGLNPGSAETLEKNKKAMMDQQSGVIPAGKRSMMFLFNPDLQLYLVKTKKLAELTVDKPIYLLTLGLIMALLIGAALFSQDLLLRKVLFENSELNTAPVAEETSEAASVASEAIATPEKTVEKTPAPAADNKWERIVQQIRPRAINSLGYLNKLKADNKSPIMTLLETELREMRRLIDPVDATLPGEFSGSKTAPHQPTFNPFLKDSFSKEMKSKEFLTSSALDAPAVEPLAPFTSTIEEITAKDVLIRKPKRENNESRKL